MENEANLHPFFMKHAIAIQSSRAISSSGRLQAVDAPLAIADNRVVSPRKYANEANWLLLQSIIDK